MVATLRGCLSDNGVFPQEELGIPMFRKTSVIRWLSIAVAFVSTKKTSSTKCCNSLHEDKSRSFNFEVWNMGRITTGKRCPSRSFHLGCPIRNSGDHWQVSAQELGLWLICQFLRKVLFLLKVVFCFGYVFWICVPLLLCFSASLLLCLDYSAMFCFAVFSPFLLLLKPK